MIGKLQASQQKVFNFICSFKRINPEKESLRCNFEAA